MFRLLPTPHPHKTQVYITPLCAHSINHTIAIHNTLLTPTHIMYPPHTSTHMHPPHTHTHAPHVSSSHPHTSCILLTPPHSLLSVINDVSDLLQDPDFNLGCSPGNTNTSTHITTTETLQQLNVDTIINHSMACWTVR